MLPLFKRHTKTEFINTITAMMLDFKIDNEKCTKCGLCVAECPVRIIEMEEIPFIREEKEKNCIKCQHCFAVCPTAAISIFGKNPEDSIEVNDNIPGAEEMTRLIKTRRSIRKYKDEDLDKDLIKNMLETAAYAPTGHNKNAVLFSVIDNKADLAKLRQMTYDAIIKAEENGTLADKYKWMLGLQKMWNTKGVDILFRNAPHMVIASAPKHLSTPETDAIIGLSYFELLANSNKIGVLWNQMINLVIDKIDPELKKTIGIPDDHVIGSVLIFGKPATKYARSVQCDGEHVNNIRL